MRDVVGTGSFTGNQQTQVDAACTGASWMHLLRGGRIIKWKGQVASCSPSLAEGLARILVRALGLSLAIGLATGSAAAADRYWDPNGTSAGQGGSGSWDLSNPAWNPTNDGVSGPYSAWNNGALDDAFFGGTGGAVTLASPIIVNSLSFDTGGYTLTGGTLTLAGTNATISTLGTNTGVDIHSTIAGSSGLTKAGAGVLRLYGANTFTGDINLDAGTIDAGSDVSLGAASNNIFTGAGAAVGLVIAGADTNRTVTIGDGGRLHLQGSGAGSALVKGNGQILVGTGVTMSNDASTYTGSTTFRGVNGIAYSYFTSIGNLGEASSLGTPTTVSDGTIVFDQSSQYSDNVVYLGDGDSSNRNWELYGEAANIRNQGTGTLSITGDVYASDSSGFLAEGADIELLGTLSGGNYLFSGNTGRAITLGGINTYAGTTSINAVTVRASVLADAGVGSSFGTGSDPISIADNGTLSYTGAGGSSNRQWTIASASILNDGSGALALSGAVDLGTVAGNSLTLGGSYGGTSTLSGVVSGTSDLISEGAGTWVLSAANTRTGAIVVDGGTLRAGNASAFGTITGVTVNGGTLDLGGFDLTAPTLEGTGGTIALGANTLTVDTETDASYAGGITGSGGLAKTGLGTLTLTGANTYTGDTSLSGGGLALDFSAPGAPATNIIAAGSTLNMAGGRLNLIGAGGSANSQSFDGLNITAGSSRIAATSGAGGSMTVNFGAITRTGGLVDFALPSAGSLTTTNTSLGGWATVNGSDYAKVEAGVITAFAADDYANKDDAGNWLTGEVISDAGGTVDTPFFGTVASNQQLGGLKYTAASESTVDIADGQTLGIDGTIIVASSVGSVGQSINGGSLTGGAGGGTLGILHNGEGAFGIASTIIDNGGATGFTKGGTGLVSLAGANTYTGVTTLSGGTLQVTSLANGGVASNIGASTADASNLVIESGTLHYVGGADVITDRGFTLVNGGASAPTIQVAASRTVEFSGLVTSPDDAGLTKSGGGTLVLSNAANDYVGVTTVTGSGVAGGSSTLSVNTLANGGVASGIGAASSDSGNIVLSDGGRLQYTGGTVGIDRGFTLGSGNGWIDVAQASTTLSVSGLAVGTGRLVKDGGGTLVLSGANTYTGDSFVNGGILRAGSGQAFGDPLAFMTVNGSGTLDLGGFDITIGGLLGNGTVDLGNSTLISSGGSANGFSGRITGTGGFTRSGGWTQTLSGCQNDYTGVTRIEGQLSVDCLADGTVASGIGASSSDAGNLVLDGGRLGYTGGSATTDRGFTLEDGNGTINVSQAATTLEFTGQIVGTGIFGKGGAGTLVLSGNNTYSGGTLVGAGILRANSSNAFGGLSAVTFGGGAGTLLDLNGFDASFTYLSGGAAAGGDIALGGATMTLGGAIGYAHFEGVITGAGSLVMRGANTQRLSSCDSAYTGSTTIDSGILEVACLNDGGVASSIGASNGDAGNLVLNGGWLSYAGTGSSTDRQLTLGASTNSALVAAGTGAIEFTSTAPITFSVADSAQTLRLTGGNTDDNRLAAGIADNGTGVTSLIKSGDGTWILTNPASTYTGVTSIVGGVLGVDKLADGGQASSLGASSADASNLVIGNGSTLRYTGTGTGDSTNRLFTLAAGTTLIESSGTGAIVFTDTGPLTLAGNNQNRTIALGGTNGGDNTLAGAIGDAGTGTTILAKNDAGTWVLTGDSTYSGNTVINDGTLVLGNGGTTGSVVSDDVILSGGTLAFNRSDSYSFGSTLSDAGGIRQFGPGTTILTADNRYGGTTNVDAGTLLVNGDQSAATGLTTVGAAGILGGTGTIGGDVAVVGGTIAPGNSPGTLTVNGNFTLDADSTLAMEFGEANVSGGALNDLIEVGGDLTLDGTLDVTESAGGSFGAGLYRVVNYDGDLTDNGLLVGTLPSGTVASDVFIQTSVAQQVNLVNTTGLTLNFWDGAAGPTFDDLINGGNGSWQNSAGNHNWTEASGAINAGYSDGAYAIFSGSAGVVTVDNSLGAVSASAMQFATDGYRIEGDSLLLLGPQSIIRVGDGTAAGAGITATIASSLTGATELVKTDAGTLVLTGTNDYTGGTAIFSGTVQVAADANLGAASGGLSFDGGTLHTTADIDSGREVALAGDGAFRTDTDTQLTLSGPIAGAGTLTKDGAGSLLLLSDAAHTGGTTIAQGTLQLGNGGTSGSLIGDIVDNGLLLVDRSDALTLDGVISGSGAFTHEGTGTTTLSALNSYAGATKIDGGTLLVNGDQSAATGATTVASGATLGGAGIIGGDVAIADGATLEPGSSAGAASTLTINGDLSLAGGAVLDMQFGEADVAGGAFNDLIDVGGDLTLDGTLDVSVAPGGEFGAGIYRVFNYGGTLIDNELALGQMPAGSETFVQTSVTGQVNLVNGAGLTLNYWDGEAGPKFDHNVAGGDGTWQNSLGNDNWTDAAGDINAAYRNGSFAIFTGAAGTVTVDNGLGQVESTGMQFAVDGYRIEGGALALTGSQSTIRVGDGTDEGAAMTATIASDLSGAAALVKTDLGTLVLAGTNSYTGGTAINGGTLQVAADAALGDAAGALSFDGGTLHTTADMSSDRSLTLAGEGTLLTDAGTRLLLGGALSGAGAFHKTGDGTLLLTADSGTYGGTASVDAGTLVANGILGGSLSVGEQGRLEGIGRVGATGNRGVIAPGSADAFGTLTIEGDYAGDGGRLEIAAALGDDSSATSRMMVGGATSGSTQVDVVNRGGLGARTQEGIKIVDVAGASSGSFALDGDYAFQGEQTVVAGAYGYRLYQGGTTTPTDGDWYLRSTLLDPAAPGEPGTPEEPGTPQEPGTQPPPLYQPGVPIYESHAGSLQEFSRFGTLQQRTGNRLWAARIGDASDAVVESGGALMRIEGRHAEFEPEVSTSNARYDADTWKLQAGVDTLFAEYATGSLVGGLFAHYGTTSSRVRSPYGTGDIETTGQGLSAAMTWYGQNGVYVDGQAQFTLYDSDLHSATAERDLATGIDGQSYGISIETGRRFALSGNWSLTPQGQLAYTATGFESFTDVFGAHVSLGTNYSVLGRAGVAASYDVDGSDAQGRIRRTHLYGIANLYYDFASGSQIKVSATEFSSRNRHLYGGVGAGGSLNWADDRYSLFGELLYSTSLQGGDDNSLGGTVGFRVRW